MVFSTILLTLFVPNANYQSERSETGKPTQFSPKFSILHFHPRILTQFPQHISTPNKMNFTMKTSCVKFHVDEMKPTDIYELGKVPCALMLYTYNPNYPLPQTVHGIMLWTGNPCEIPDIHGHTHFVHYPKNSQEIQIALGELSNGHGSVTAYHGDMITNDGYSLQYIIDTLLK